MTRIPVGVIVGSNRRESINRRLALALTRLVEDRFAWRWIRIDDLPMYNQDLEVDRPETVRRFTAEVAGVPALLFVTAVLSGFTILREIGPQEEGEIVQDEDRIAKVEWP